MKHHGSTKAPRSKVKKVKNLNSFVSWFEIPVANLERAIHFYSTIFNNTFETVQTLTHTMAFFPEGMGVNGALVFGDGCIPGSTGSLLYLNTGSDLDIALEKVIISGGQILMGKTIISEEMGYYSLILDSEGNRLALHSKS